MCEAEFWKTQAGELSDREISRRYGVAATTVRRYRAQNKIPPYTPSGELPTAVVTRMEFETDYSLYKTLGIPLKKLREARVRLGIVGPKPQRQKFQPLENIWTAEVISLLGTMSDYELADRLKVSNYPIKSKRKELGIPAYKKTYPEITPEIAAQFGVTSDKVLGERLGVSANFIRSARLKWNAKTQS